MPTIWDAAEKVMKIKIITDNRRATAGEYRASIMAPWVRNGTRRMARAPSIIRKVASSTGTP
ncbi:hypothetical protein [Gemmiger sp. An120]|uniref:hypothetical protein n=1 Tax=Gemmiger sp. An120 TaxID=1965549 RepID=UPI001FA91965|nr:hypothetical protein [Gemmiger sp. An120]